MAERMTLTYLDLHDLIRAQVVAEADPERQRAWAVMTAQVHRLSAGEVPEVLPAVKAELRRVAEERAAPTAAAHVWGKDGRCFEPTCTAWSGGVNADYCPDIPF